MPRKKTEELANPHETIEDAGTLETNERFDSADITEKEIVLSIENESDDYNTADNDNQLEPMPPQRRQREPSQSADTVLTLESGAKIETVRDRENAIWHELKNSQITGSHLTGTLGKVERLENGVIITVVDYKGQRIAIPLREMELNLHRPAGQSDDEYTERSMRVLNRMMGADIDFVVRGITDTGEERAAVASRRAAMFRLRKRYYLTMSSGKAQVYPGRIVQARIVAVSRLAIRVEIFGVETSIRSSDLSWGYITDCRDSYFVGDCVQVRIIDIEGDTPDELRVKADIKSLTENTTHKKLLALKPQTNCIGNVTDVSGGIVFVNLVDGIRAIAHKCFDRRKPGRGDDVLFVVTRIDEDRSVAVGIISRIIKRNI